MIDLTVENIIKKRKELKLSQAKLAKACDVPQSTIGRIESKKFLPSMQTLEKIFQVLGMEFVCREKDDRPAYVRKWDNVGFTCYWKDEPVSEVHVENMKVHVKRFVKNHPVKQIFSVEEMDVFKLTEILKTRCWEDNRAGIDDLLKKIGVPFYDPLEIVKKTHGVSYNDFLWIQFRGEHLHWKDVAPRRFRNV